MNKQDIDTIVPLLPIQQGFLWHCLKEDTQSGILQLCCTLQGELDTERFQQAWQATANRHQALRSSVHWQDVKAPMQLVMKKATLPWTVHDLRGETDIPQSLEALLAVDRKQPLDLTRAPAYRLALFETGNNTHEFAWTLSHVLLDGWSCAIVVAEVIKQYTSLVNTGKCVDKDAPGLTDYHRWLRQQDRDALRAWWQGYLPDTLQRPALPGRRDNTGTSVNLRDEPVSGSCQIALDPTEWTDLQRSIRQSGLSLNAILQGTWAILLADNGSAEHAVFATTVSGREIDLPNASERVGMLINLVPVVVAFNQQLSVMEWLKEIQNQFYASIPYAFASPRDIQAASGQSASLYDSLLVLENQPSVESTDLLEVRNFRSGILSDLDLTLVVIPGTTLNLELIYKQKHFIHDDMQALLDQFRKTLLALPTLYDHKVTALQPFLEQSIATNQPSQPAQPDPVPAATQLRPKPLLTRLEQQLLEIWQQEMEIAHIELNDNFFELGGTSLQAVLIFDRIQSVTGFQLPTTTLFNAPSVITLAAVMQQQDPLSLWSTTVEINGTGHKLPLFIPVVSPDMLMYKNLSSHLGEDQPVYALRAADASLSTDELAAKLVEHIQSIQPDGPYHIAGVSGAGLLAWVMAQQLQEQNQEVALLALLDTYGPDYPVLKPPLPRLASVSSHFFIRFCQATRRGLSKRVPLLSRFLKTAPTQKPQAGGISGIQVESNMHLLDEYNERIAQEFEESLDFVLDVTRQQPLLERAINLLCLGMTRVRYGSFSMRIAFIVFIQGLWLEYKRKALPENQQFQSKSIDVIKNRHEKMYSSLTPYSGRIVYVKVNERPAAVVDDPYVGWKSLVNGHMEIVEVPGSHTSLLKHPNVVTLANILSRELTHTPGLSVERKIG